MVTIDRIIIVKMLIIKWLFHTKAMISKTAITNSEGNFQNTAELSYASSRGVGAAPGGTIQSSWERQDAIPSGQR